VVSSVACFRPRSGIGVRCPCRGAPSPCLSFHFSIALTRDTARAQQPERMRRIGVLMAYEVSDPEGKALRLYGFTRGLSVLGWTDGRNVRLDVRWTGGALCPALASAGGAIISQNYSAAARASWLTTDSAIWVSASSVAFSSLSVASSKVTAFLSPNSSAHVRRVP
jgi:hypothetical protein